MRVRIDQAACAGHGQCAATAPDVYELDDDGFVLPVTSVADDDRSREHAVDGANACPENAITITEENA